MTPNITLLYLMAGFYSCLVLTNLLIVATAFASNGRKPDTIGIIETILIFGLCLIPLLIPVSLFIKRRKINE